MLYLSIGAFFGAILRFLFDQLTKQSERRFPLGTFIVNMVGAFLAGTIVGAGMSMNWMFFLVIGFAGAFTTFSTFSMEIVQLCKDHEWSTGLFYSFLSLALGICAAFIGYYIFL